MNSNSTNCLEDINTRTSYCRLVKFVRHLYQNTIDSSFSKSGVCPYVTAERFHSFADPQIKCVSVAAPAVTSLPFPFK